MSAIDDLTTFIYSYSKVLVHRTELNNKGFSDSVIDLAVNQAILYSVNNSNWFLVLPSALSTITVNSDGSSTIIPKIDTFTLTQTTSDPILVAEITKLRFLFRELVLYFAMLGFDDIPIHLLDLLND